MTLDARVARTRDQLYGTMLRLGSERAIENVTSLEVIEESGISKATFYRHAKSPADLAADYVSEELLLNVDEFLANSPGETAAERLRAHEISLRRLWQQLTRDYDFLRNSISHERSATLPVISRIQAAAQIGYSLQHSHAIEIPEPLQGEDIGWAIDFLSRQYASAVTGMVVSWFRRPEPTSVELFINLYFYLMPGWQRKLVGLN